MAADVPDKGSPHDRARIIRRYLSALDSRKPGRTAARTAESVVQRMHQVDTLLMSADPVQRLFLTQERIDLHAEQLRLATSTGDFVELEKAFTRVARAWGDRHDITYSAWRQVGVGTDVLTKAGITAAQKPQRPQAAAAPKAVTNGDESTVPQPQPQPDPSKAERPVKKGPTAKKAPAAKKTASPKNAGEPKLDATTPEQQRLPAEAHLLS